MSPLRADGANGAPGNGSPEALIEIAPTVADILTAAILRRLPWTYDA
jgi:hypothetical protein